MGKLDGSCLCGNVTYTCDADPIASVNCHCRDCQRSSGAAFMTVVVVPADSIQIQGETLSEFSVAGEDHGKSNSRHFCTRCGAQLLTKPEAYPGLVFIKSGTLNDASLVRPAMDIWTESKQPWTDHGQRPTAPRDPSAQATAALAD
jgi:hypothetical protein